MVAPVLRPAFRRMLAAALVPALAGCAASAPAEDTGDPDPDPVMSAAIEAPLMVDPELSADNPRNLAIDPPHPVDRALPLPDDAP